MVPGILDRDRRGHSVLELLQSTLRARAPMWAVRIWHMSSNDYVPQDRRRIYIVGWNKMFSAHGPLPPPEPPLRRCLADFLRQSRPWVEESHLSTFAWDRLGYYKTICKHCVPAGTLASIELDRDWTRQWGGSGPVSFVRQDCVMTLRTRNKPIWIFGHSLDGQVSRELDPLERVVLQGFPPQVAFGLKECDVLKRTGNAMTVPVVQVVLAQCLGAMAQELTRRQGGPSLALAQHQQASPQHDKDRHWP